MADHRLRLAVDIGGTFTDVVLDGAGQRQTTKVLTTHSDPADGVLQGIRRVLSAAGARPGDVGLVLHGTTLATNALIERRGAVTALLTTEGHRDAVEMAFENRFEQYDVDIDRPAPLVPRPLRLPVSERLAADGSVLRALDPDSVARWLPLLEARGVTSIAVGFLHSYVNAEHERAVGALLRAALPAVAVTLSCDVCPEIREYERLSTTCANAYIKPLMARYLASLARQLGALGMGCPVLLMTSGGGLTTLETAAEFPIRLVESGPAGGAMLAARVAAEGGYHRVLSFDMGGTTAKICLIDDGVPLLSRAFEVDRVYRFKKGSGLPVRVPVIEMVEIGAGGGSIAGMDKLGRIQVGPASAGSEPGPACYGRGGDRATVTDADLVLGRIDPASFAGGSLPLDATAAERALTTTLGAQLDRDAVGAAYAVAAVVDENMAGAARAHASEWGTDVASRTLEAFGGAAPLHAAALANKLHIDRVIVPTGAGVGSAIGFLLAPVSYEVVRSRYQRLSAFEADAANAVLAEMYDEAAAVVRAAAPDDDWREERRAYMRYLGQGYEIAVPVASGTLTDADAARLREAFEHEYRRLYGRLIPGLDVELMSWTLTVVAGEPEAPAALSEPEPVRLAGGGSGRLYDAAAGGKVAVAVHHRADLTPGHHGAGPALVVEDQTTTVVPPGFDLRVDARGHLLLERRQEEAP
ncbi:MAG: hydantoinase/oxoprolinase family protein [Pseudomonadales bacterium]